MYGFVAALLLVAFIAAIVLTVIIYKRYVGSVGGGLRIDPRDQRTWGPFLNFDTLIIDKVLKALYIFNAIFLAFALCVLAIGMLFEGFGQFMAFLCVAVIALVAGELLLRLGYELIMMTIVIARNTSAIKRKLCQDEVADEDGISSLTPGSAPVSEPAAEPAYVYVPLVAEPAPTPAPEPAPTPAPEPVAAPEPAAEPAPVAPINELGAAVSSCPQCGAAVTSSDKFCSVCGFKLQ